MADKKRKGLMDVLAEYRREQNSDGGTKGKGPVASGKTYGKTLKQNKKEDASGPKVLAPKKKPVAKKTTPAKTAGKAGSSTKAQPPKAPASVQKGNGDGTYGKSMPSNPKVGITMAPRKKRPGTGRTGEAAAKAANRKPTPKKSMTAAERRAMRLKARRGR